MTLTISSNIAASIAHRSVTQTTNAIERSISKLSTGLRVQSARDDAASMAIGSRIRAQIVALKSQQQNATQTTSMLQVAESVYARTQDMLIRMRALTAQAQSSNLSATERNMLNTEYQHLKSEINRLASSARFGGTSLLDSSGSLSFNAPTNVAASVIGALEYAVADINGDSIMDIIYCGASGGQKAIEIKFGTREGTYTTGYTNTNLGAGQMDYVVTGDFNGDGQTDIAAYAWGTGLGSVLMNNGNGGFTISNIALTGNITYVCADMNNDGRDDLVGTTVFGGTTGSVSLSQGNGSFSTSTFTTSIGISSFDIGDLNNDGVKDIVVRATGMLIGGIMNNGSGSFSGTVLTNGTFTWASYTRAVDLNGDGILDSHSIAGGATYANVCLGNGNGTFQSQLQIDTLAGGNLVDSIFADLNGDGYADFICANTDGTITARLGAANMTFSNTLLTLSTGGITLGSTGNEFMLRDMDNDGRMDLVVRHNGVSPTILYNNSNVGYQTSIRVGGDAVATNNITLNLSSTRLNVLDIDLQNSSITNIGTAVRAEDSILNALTKVIYFRTSIGAIMNRLDAVITNIATIHENQEMARSSYLDLNVAAEMSLLTSKQIIQQAGISMLMQARTSQKVLLELFSEKEDFFLQN